MKIGIVTVPYITVDKHLELAVEAYKSFITKHETYNVAVVNHSRNPEDLRTIELYNDKVIINDKNILARAWNKGIKDCIENKCDLIFVPNLDILCRPDTIDNLVLEPGETFLLWSATQSLDIDTYLTDALVTEYDDGGDFFCFMMRPTLFEKVGEFDEGFAPAYFEDNDMDYRIKLAGFKAIKLYNAVAFHHGSASLVLDENNKEKNNYTFPENLNRYMFKWGGVPERETLTHPFGGDETDFKYLPDNLDEKSE